MDFGSVDLGLLSRSDKLRLLDLLEEHERRERERKPLYSPNPGQQLVHESEAAFRWVFAGNGSGKSALSAVETKWFLDGYNPVKEILTKTPSRTIVVLDSPAKVDDVWLPELSKWMTIDEKSLDKRGKPYYSRLTRPTGSELLFMFHDQNPMLFESIEADYIIFDEPPPRHIYISLLRGLRKSDSQPKILVVGTPIASSWMRKEVYEPWARGELDDTECFKFSSDVNKENVNWAFVEKNIFSKYSDKEIRMRRHGEFFDLGGLALADLFRRDTHSVEAPKWPPNWPCVVAIDPHPRKNHVAVLLGVTPENSLVALKELSSKAAPSDFAHELKEWYQGYRVVDIVCDSLGSGDLTGGEGRLSFIQVLKDRGIRVRATTYNEKRDEAFIQMIQEVLRVPEEADNFGKKEPLLKIVRNCRGLIADIETVEWQKIKNVDEFKPKLAIEAKDFLACLKYALAAQPHFKKGKERVIKSHGHVGWGTRR